MGKKVNKSFAAISIRGLAILIKLLLVSYLAKHLTESDFGIYSIFVYCIAFFSTLLGLEYRNHNARNILKGEDAFSFIKEQIIFHSTTYLFLIPICLTVFIFGWIPNAFILLFLVILVLDHLSQEIINLLILYSKPVISTFLFFIKSSLWFIPFFLFSEEINSSGLETILYFWAAGQFLSLLIGVLILSRLLQVHKSPWYFDFGVIKNQLIKSYPFLISALSIRGLYAFDKVVLKHYHGEEAVGILSFYFVIAIMIQTVVETGINSIIFPDLIKSYMNKDVAKAKKLSGYMVLGIIFVFTFVTVFSILGLDNILYYLNKKTFLEYKSLLYIYLLSGGLICLSFVPHFKLYAFKLDKLLSYVNLTSLLIGLCFYFILTPFLGIYGTALGFLMSSLSLFLIKFFFARKRVSQMIPK